MKKIIVGLFALSALTFASCSNGDYQADPASPANGAVNPKTPLGDDEFTWNGSEPISMKINGTPWTADQASFYLDTSGSNVITGTKDGKAGVIAMYLRDVWKGNSYPMEWKNYSRRAAWGDSVGNNEWVIYTSDRSNSGGIRIIRNDSAVIEGKFYFKGVSINEEVVNISEGYFKINKW